MSISGSFNITSKVHIKEGQWIGIVNETDDPNRKQMLKVLQKIQLANHPGDEVYELCDLEGFKYTYIPWKNTMKFAQGHILSFHDSHRIAIANSELSGILNLMLTNIPRLGKTDDFKKEASLKVLENPAGGQQPAAPAPSPAPAGRPREATEETTRPRERSASQSQQPAAPAPSPAPAGRPREVTREREREASRPSFQRPTFEQHSSIDDEYDPFEGLREDSVVAGDPTRKEVFLAPTDDVKKA